MDVIFPKKSNAERKGSRAMTWLLTKKTTVRHPGVEYDSLNSICCEKKMTNRPQDILKNEIENYALQRKRNSTFELRCVHIGTCMYCTHAYNQSLRYCELGQS